MICMHCCTYAKFMTGGVVMIARLTLNSPRIYRSIDHGVTKAPYERRFSPYDFNGGCVKAKGRSDGRVCMHGSANT